MRPGILEAWAFWDPVPPWCFRGWWYVHAGKPLSWCFVYLNLFLCFVCFVFVFVLAPKLFLFSCWSSPSRNARSYVMRGIPKRSRLQGGVYMYINSETAFPYAFPRKLLIDPHRISWFEGVTSYRILLLRHCRLGRSWMAGSLKT